MRTVLHRDGTEFAIVTTAESEEEFRQQFADALEEMIEAGEVPSGTWAFAIDGWLKQASEIICKYRGYKSEVVERRTLIAGLLDPDKAVVTVGRGEELAVA